MVFVDTSALHAVLDRDDDNHATARTTWERIASLIGCPADTYYVLLETVALVQSRLGMPAVRSFQERIIPILQVYWVKESDDGTAIEMMIAADRRRLSLVDGTSFLTMRSHTVSDVFCFDKHFEEQGFTLV
jgi:uncharacterized protein